LHEFIDFTFVEFLHVTLESTLRNLLYPANIALTEPTTFNSFLDPCVDTGKPARIVLLDSKANVKWLDQVFLRGNFLVDHTALADELYLRFGNPPDLPSRIGFQD
jgi:hypothetical protein